MSVVRKAPAALAALGGLVSTGLGVRWILTHKDLTVEDFWKLGHLDDLYDNSQDVANRARDDMTGDDLDRTHYEVHMANMHEMQENQRLNYEMQENQRLNYEPLSVKTAEIRLLSILSADSPDDTIQYCLETVPMDSGLTYAALSYEWGSIKKSARRHIFVNDQLAEVTASLYYAL
jgi:hypothetical protein